MKETFPTHSQARGSKSPVSIATTSHFKNRIVLALGRFWKRFLHEAEHFAYRVAGLPTAIRHIFKSKAPSSALEPAKYLHWVHGRTYWQLPSGPLKGLVAAIVWPFALVISIAVFTRRNGAEIRTRTGKSIMSQLREQAQMAVGPSIAPFWYYMFELHDDRRRQQADLYLTAHETIGPAYTLLQPAEGSDALADKVGFAASCARLGITAVPVLFHVSAGEIVTSEGAAPVLPDVDLFVKPRQGNGGHNSERWDYLGDGRYRNSAGDTVTREVLAARLKHQSFTQDFVVQPRLENHPALADVSNGALVTSRILTCRNEAGDYEATNAAFRMAIGGNSVVDNFHQGGLATAVDMATGEIGQASDMGVRPGVGWREVHPVSGARFAGRHLPLWKESIELACKAHAAFPQHVVVGWDVAMLADGVSIIEGNAKPDLDIHQRVERRPLGDQRIAKLLAFNLAQLKTARPVS